MMLVRKDSKLPLGLIRSLHCLLMTMASINCLIPLQSVNQSSAQRSKTALNCHHCTCKTFNFRRASSNMVWFMKNYKPKIDQHIIELPFESTRSVLLSPSRMTKSFTDEYRINSLVFNSPKIVARFILVCRILCNGM